MYAEESITYEYYKFANAIIEYNHANIGTIKCPIVSIPLYICLKEVQNVYRNGWIL